MLSYINNIFINISNNKLFIGLVMIFLNISSKYININLSKNQEALIKRISKEVLIFIIAFMGTRDILSSIILTIIYIILANYILNENSKFCLLSEKYKHLSSVIDINNDNHISKEEIEKATEILRKAKKQEELMNQYTMLNSLSNNLYN